MDELQTGPKLEVAPDDQSGLRRMALVVFTVAAGYFLWTEHRAHVIEYLPWTFLLICPLMHIFMHRGHGSHGANSDEGHGGHES
jgi:hypothetical protein